MDNFIKIINNFLEGTNLSAEISQTIYIISIVAILSVACIIGYKLTNKFVLTIVTRIVKRTKTTYDDIFLEKKVFNKLAQITPALIINYTLPNVINSAPRLAEFLSDVSQLWIVVVVTLTIYAFIDGLNDVYQHSKISRNRSIKGYLQLAKIVTAIIAIFSVVAIFDDEFEVTKVFAGLGAMAAVLLLVFRDTILGLVASVQIAANDMVRLGDWIVMPKYNADGDVLEINLNTIKIQNWDKTISTIPVYALVTDSFQNWRGMSESGGRRIKRSINIDMNSVKFADKELLNKLGNFHLIKDYVEQKEKELQDYNNKLGLNEEIVINTKKQTNLGIFRKYLEAYLHMMPTIHEDMTFLVRHLQPTEKGIPMEIYVFSNKQEWSAYESIQADIFDHVLAIIKEFDLNVFQIPTGKDWQNLRTMD